MCDFVFLFFFIVIDDATKEVVYRDYIDISVAVATPRVGLGRIGKFFSQALTILLGEEIDFFCDSS